MIQNYLPNRVQQLKIDYDTISKYNKNIIYSQITGFPAPHQNVPAFDFTIQGMSGLMHCTGEPDGPPYKVGYAVTDVLGSHHTFNGILAAVLHKERTGEGQYIETSLLQSALYSMPYVISSQLNGDTDYMRLGNSH